VLVLVRHGESEANASRLLLGRTDAPLTELGRAQAAALRSVLQQPPGELRTSPLRRARDTARLLAPGCPALVDERWVEIDYGELDGQPLDQVPAEVWRRWRHDRDFRPSGGETLAEVEARVTAACRELFASGGAGARVPGSDVVVVSHVTPIKAAVAWALGVAGLHWRLHLSTGSVTRIGWERDAPVLYGYNAVALAPAPGGAPQSARA
jgi:broad specificity phosphatase PhoE